MKPRRLAHVAITAAACLMDLQACSQTAAAPSSEASPTFSQGQLEDATLGAASKATHAARATQAVVARASAAARQKQATENAQGTAYTASLTADAAQLKAPATRVAFSDLDVQTP